jgi:hypothetical protein
MFDDLIHCAGSCDRAHVASASSRELARMMPTMITARLAIVVHDLGGSSAAPLGCEGASTRRHRIGCWGLLAVRALFLSLAGLRTSGAY